MLGDGCDQSEDYNIIYVPKPATCHQVFTKKEKSSSPDDYDHRITHCSQPLLDPSCSEDDSDEITNSDCSLKGTSPSNDSRSQSRSRSRAHSKDKLRPKSKQEVERMLATLTRQPIICPLLECRRSMSMTGVLFHVLLDHGYRVVEQFKYNRSFLMFHPQAIPYNRIKILGVVAYGGHGTVGNFPADRGICKKNSFLEGSYTDYTSHLPVFVMACRSTYKDIFTKTKMGIYDDSLCPDESIILLWLVSVATTCRVYGTITAMDKDMSYARSKILRVRSIHQTHNPNTFVCESESVLCLHVAEMVRLSRNETQCITLELVLNEYERRKNRKIANK